MGLLEKVHRSPEDFKSLRLQMGHKTFPGIPFLNETKVIFVIHILIKVTASATFFYAYGSDQ
jgi:hypothetical protein